MSGVQNDKSFEGMLREMRSNITELQRRQTGAPAGLTPIFPTPDSLVGAFVQPDGTILLTGTAGSWVQLPRIFRDDFAGYKIVFSMKTTGGIASSPLFRMMQGTTMDTGGTSYANTRAFIGLDGIVASAFSFNGYGMLTNGGDSGPATGTMEVIAPYKAFERTAVTFSTNQAGVNHWGGSTYTANAAQDGIAFQRGPASTTTDGWLKIFGYR